MKEGSRCRPYCCGHIADIFEEVPVFSKSILPSVQNVLNLITKVWQAISSASQIKPNPFYSKTEISKGYY